MRKKHQPTLAISNTAPLRSLSSQKPKLKVISPGIPAVSKALKPSLSPSIGRVGVLQSLLRAEARFLVRLRDEAAQRCRIKSDVEAIQRDLNHENVIHVARFFFLMKALDCSTPEAVEALIESHNAKVRSMIDAEDYRLRTRKELEKAVFKDQQQYICVKTVRDRNRAVFAKTEIASLLFDHMGRDSAIRTLELLVSAGLLVEEDSDPLTGTNRKLMMTNGILEDAVADYLSDLEQQITTPTMD